LEIVRDIRDFKYQSNDYDFANDMIKQDLLSKVYDSYWDVSTLHTVADSMQKEITRLKIKHRKKMDAIRDYHTERHNKLKKDHQDNIARLKQKYRDRNENEIKEVKQYYQESRTKAIEGRHKTEMRNKIKKVVSDLNRILNKGTKERNVKIELQESVKKALLSATVVASLNVEGFSLESFQKATRADVDARIAEFKKALA
jgi:hypothetical protein